MFKNLEGKHYAVIAAMLLSISAQLGALPHGWSDVLTPGFVAGVLGALGTTITAIYVGAPKQPWDGTLRRGADVRAADAAVTKAQTDVTATTAAAVSKAALEIKP